MRLSESLHRAIEEAALPVGSRREWKDGWHIKLRSGKWVKDTAKNRKKLKKQQEAIKLKSTIDKFKDSLDKGYVEVGGKRVPFGSGMSFKEHVREAKKTMKKHRTRISPLMGELKGMAGPDAEVQGRVKLMESVLGKLIRKPDEYKKPSDLTDVTGTRVIHNTVDEVMNTVAKLKKRFTIKDDEDAINNPKGDYRSYHLIIQDDDGEDKEVQIRTRNQNTFADWAHDIYKPQTPEQVKAFKSGTKSRKEVDEFSRGISEFLYAQDTGKNPPPPPRPPCPEVVKGTLGCI